MFRSVIAATALFAAAASAAQAQGYGAYASNNPSATGLTGDAYIIRLATSGKDIPTIRAEIFDAAFAACRQAPRIANLFEKSICIRQARIDAFRQLDRVVAERQRAG